VIGAMGDARGLGPLPVRLEVRVGAVAALGLSWTPDLGPLAKV
jgi:hypothetical protein